MAKIALNGRALGENRSERRQQNCHGTAVHSTYIAEDDFFYQYASNELQALQEDKEQQ
jgi:hypothetical protein